MTKNETVKTYQVSDDDHTACPRTLTRKKAFIKMNGKCDIELVYILRKVSLYQSLNVN